MKRTLSLTLMVAVGLAAATGCADTSNHPTETKRCSTIAAERVTADETKVNTRQCGMLRLSDDTLAGQRLIVGYDYDFAVRGDRIVRIIEAKYTTAG